MSALRHRIRIDIVNYFLFPIKPKCPRLQSRFSKDEEYSLPY